MATHFRQLDVKDAENASCLVLKLSDAFVVDVKSAEQFLHSLSTESFESRLRSSEFIYWGAFTPNHDLVGLVGVKSRSHLYHLFVENLQQGKGVGKMLLHHANKHLSGEIKTVNASLNALEFYKKLGFIPTQEEVIKDGVAFVPMIFKMHVS